MITAKTKSGFEIELEDPAWTTWNWWTPWTK